MKNNASGTNIRQAPVPLLVPLTFVALACSAPLAPGSLLVGTWSSADATLAAAPTGASLTIPCIAAHFDPIRLDDSLTFRSTGVVTRAGGLVTVHPGDPFSLNGRVVGNRVVIPYPWIVRDAGADTLSPGDGTIHVCNA